MNITKSINTQLIIVDDGSTEDIYDIVKYVPRTWIRFAKHVGYTEAIRKALPLIDAEKVFFLRNGGLWDIELIGELLVLDKEVVL